MVLVSACPWGMSIGLWVLLLKRVNFITWKVCFARGFTAACVGGRGFVVFWASDRANRSFPQYFTVMMWIWIYTPVVPGLSHICEFLNMNFPFCSNQTCCCYILRIYASCLNQEQLMWLMCTEHWLHSWEAAAPLASAKMPDRPVRHWGWIRDMMLSVCLVIYTNKLVSSHWSGLQPRVKKKGWKSVPPYVRPWFSVTIG